ncbi:thermonuclease family protein [Pelagibacterium montanilacus]|uniref:thermonuclease family protein n=1 Tax=Pelagibacterium montanilacus TaxID=2185280 RepID=UPI001FEACF4D|nr:thermonuclease family protein [Pelagibacterium montanilacus]
MFRRLLVTVLGLATLWSSPSVAQVCAALEAGERARVVSVTDGDTIELEGGLTVRLVGIQAPKLPLGRPDFEAWPLADEAKALVVDLVEGAEVELHYGGERRDRHGRALAHVMRVDGDGPAWVQGEVLRAGLARVYSFPDNRNCLDALYAAEREARADRRGLWRDSFYAVRDAADPLGLLEHRGGYELVEGRVLNAERVRDLVYLNFGRRWREDFTVVIESDGLEAFSGAGLDPLALDGAVIRVRGWIEELDGPRVIVTHPEQIEILSGQ